jgi:hypothetical protein
LLKQYKTKIIKNKEWLIWYNLYMQKNWIWATGLLVVALGAAVALGYFKPAPPTTSVSNADDMAVRTFVIEFASKFKNVSLLADDVSDQLAKEYSTYVSPELLAKWQSKEESAPGRYTSSPWPDRIEVVEVVPESPGTYRVEGNVIEIANVDTPMEPVAIYPLTLQVKKEGNGFKVIALSKGAYSEIPHRQTIVGYWECLPHKDTAGPQTTECAFGIAVDQSDGHFAVNTSLMSTYPVDFPTGTKVRVSGVVTPANQLSSIQKYDIDGIINATMIEKI